MCSSLSSICRSSLPDCFITFLVFQCNLLLFYSLWASLVAQLAKNLPAVQETRVRSLGWKDPLEKEMATHSSNLAWRIPWTEEPVGIQSIRHKESNMTECLSMEDNLSRQFNAMLCYAKSLQSCPTLCDPIDSSPPGSPVPGILQTRTLEWVAISFSNA